MEPVVRSLPDGVEIFLDPRGGDRCMRVSRHDDVGLVVVSLWRDSVCVGSMRVPHDDVPRLIAALATGLAGTVPDSAEQREAG
jgi:hypothetical protein